MFWTLKLTQRRSAWNVYSKCKYCISQKIQQLNYFVRVVQHLNYFPARVIQQFSTYKNYFLRACWDILRVVAVQLRLRTLILSFPTGFTSTSKNKKVVIKNNIKFWPIKSGVLQIKPLLCTSRERDLVQIWSGNERGQKNGADFKICSSAVDFTSKLIFILAKQIKYPLKSSFIPCILNAWQDYLFAWTKLKFAVKQLNPWCIATDCWFPVRYRWIRPA